MGERHINTATTTPKCGSTNDNHLPPVGEEDGGNGPDNLINVIWAEWDEITDEPTGTMYDCGQVKRADAWEAILDAHLTADRLGWEGGNAYLTDSEGHRILLACDVDDVPLDVPMPADDDEEEEEDEGGDWDGGGEDDDDYGDFDADAVEHWPTTMLPQTKTREQGDRS